MTKCRNMEALIAASLYEALDQGEQEALHTHLSACAACRNQYTSMQSLVTRLAPEPIPFRGDLLPSIREALRHDQPRPWYAVWKGMIVATASFLAVFVVVAISVIGSGGAVNDGVDATQSPHTPLDEARRLASADDPAGALKVLKAALETAPNGLEAGLLQLEMAELEYNSFRRYESSYSIYKAVRDSNPEAWTQSPGRVKERFDLLTEARDANFEPLYQIDAALKQGDSGMPALEQVMARYPGRSVAQAAMETMVAMADGEGVARLEVARSRCTNPVAVAQLDVRLGEAYCADNLDPAKGKALLHSVAERPYAVPAQMARDVLARLEAGERP